MEPNLITLSGIANGAAEELFQAALRDALKNMDDPNTDWKTPRTIRLSFTMRTDEQRRAGDVEIECTTKFPGIRSVGTRVFFGRHEGQLAAAEAPRQEEMFPQAAGRPQAVAPATEVAGA